MSGRRKTVRISEAEWRIMNVLWDHCRTEEAAGLTLGEIVRDITEETGWTNTTIRTLIIRLADKGIVKIDKTTGVYKYTPNIRKSECIQEEIDSFVARVFDNSLVVVMGHTAQIDLEDKRQSGFIPYIEHFQKRPDIADYVKLTSSMRGKIATWADEIDSN